MKQTALRCINFSLTSWIFWMRYTSFLYNLDCVQMMDMMPEVSSSRMSPFISPISPKMVLKQSSAMGSRLYSSPLRFCIQILRIKIKYSYTTIIAYQSLLMQIIQQKQNNVQIREVRTKRLALNLAQKEALERVFRTYLQPDFSEGEVRAILVKGVPSEFRNYVWTQLIPNKNGITPQQFMQLMQQLALYRTHVTYQEMPHLQPQQHLHNNQQNNIQRQTENPETANQNANKMMKWLKIIAQDIPRTFPEIRVFHNDEEQRQKLSNILGCFAIYRQDVGYIQGLSLLGALFLQELNTEYRAFTALTTIITTTVLYDFYTFSQSVRQNMHQSISERLQKKAADLHQHLTQMNIDLKMIVMEWIMTLFCRIFQLDSILNIWDILFTHRLTRNILAHLCTEIIIARAEDIAIMTEPAIISKLLRSGKLAIQQEERIFSQLRELQIE